MSAVDIVQKCQAGEALSADDFTALIAAVEDAATPEIPRLRAVQQLGPQAAHHAELGIKAFAALVAVIAGDGSAPALLTAAIGGLVDLSRNKNEKQFEMVRESADVVAQVALEGSGFDDAVRARGKQAFDELLDIDFRACIMKLLHWLSDEREGDTEEQLLAERGFAMHTLGRLARDKKRADAWTAEVQQQFLTFAKLVLAVASADQFRQLASIAAHLPSVKELKAAPLLETVLALPLDDVRGLESFATTAFHVPADVTNDDAVEKVMGTFAAPKNAAVAAAAAKALAVASRMASAEAAAKHLPAVAAALEADDRSVWTKTEALLFAFATLGAKAAEHFLPALASETLQAQLTATADAAKAAHPLALFATKKLVADGSATKRHGEALDCLRNVAAVATAVLEKKVANLPKPSWEGKKSLPQKPQPKAAVGAKASKQGQSKKRPAAAQGGKKDKKRR